MNEMTKQHGWTWGIHGLFWILLCGLIVFILSQILVSNLAILVGTVVNLSGFMILVYGHLSYLLPRYFDQRKYKKYVLGLILLLAITSVLRFFIGWGLVVEMKLGIEETFTPTYLGSMFFGGVFILFISIPLRLIDNLFKKRELEKTLKTHQLEAELRFLKAQVNPHFLFNALNNIYSLSFTESKKAPEMILKLSDMMSYMLYDCKNERVKLSAEIAYLKNYIDLQQLKKEGDLNISFETNSSSSSIFITPMLFIPFFENAFKHGNLEDTKNGWLKSTLNTEGSDLTFFIENTLRKTNTKDQKGGVGLENIRDRLKLLFPNKHQLDIDRKENTFSVNLKLNLATE